MDTLAYIRHALRGIYPPREVDGFIRLIMEHVCGLAPYQLLLGKGTEISDTEEARIREIVDRLREEEPLQYILGEETFCGIRLEVNPSVLIPRPETAELVDLILREQAAREAPLPRILDIGTGSGCIAIALARRLPGATIHALDISPDALATARRNAEQAGVAIRFHQYDILSAKQDASFPPDDGERHSLPLPFQLIVSNPPYIRELEKGEMERNVLAYEPAGALFVPDEDPLLFYRAIARAGKRWLAEGGWLYFEINAALGEACCELLADEGYGQIGLVRDSFGKDRIVKAQKDRI